MKQFGQLRAHANRMAGAVRIAPVLLVALLTAVATSLPATALAQAKAGALRDACRDDFQRYCAKTQRGAGRIRQCMLDHADQLTPQCRDSLKALQGQRQQ